MTNANDITNVCVEANTYTNDALFEAVTEQNGSEYTEAVGNYLTEMELFRKISRTGTQVFV